MKAIFLLALALTCAVFSGCGGSGKSTWTAPDLSRALLDGGGTASGAGVTTRTWRIVAISGNQNYVGGSSADLPCPVTLTDPSDSSQTLTCGASDIVTIKSDGTFKFKGFGKTWSLDGTKVMLDYGAALGVQITDITPETVGGKQRLRVLQVSQTRGGVPDTHDDGSVIVLEEAAM
jgi:hypothetical protein